MMFQPRPAPGAIAVWVSLPRGLEEDLGGVKGVGGLQGGEGGELQGARVQELGQEQCL